MANKVDHRRRIEEYAKANGWTIGLTGSTHLKITKPGCEMVFASQSPNCNFAWRKVIAQMKKNERNGAKQNGS